MASPVSSNEAYLSRLNGTFAARLRRLIAYAETTLGYDVTITSGFRSYQEQAALHAQNPSNARPGTSRHESGIAADVNLRNRKTGQVVRKADSLATWRATGWPAAAEKFGLHWAGSFGGYHDPVHIELLSGWEELTNSPTKKTAMWVGIIVLVIVILGVSFALIQRYGDVKL